MATLSLTWAGVARKAKAAPALRGQGGYGAKAVASQLLLRKLAVRPQSFPTSTPKGQGRPRLLREETPSRMLGMCLLGT